MISPRIAILGAGAIGGYYGARLAQHGHEVHFLMRSGFAHAREHGLTIRSVDGDFVLPGEKIRVYDNVAAMPKVDLVVITLKSTENHHLSRLIPPLLKDGSAILTLQNGLGNEDYLAALFGAQRVIGGMAFVCINRDGAGRIDHQESGYVRLAEFEGPGRSERVSGIVEMFNASGIRTSAIDDLKVGRWDKLIWNIPFNGLTALLDVTTDRLLASERGVRQVDAIMQEVIAAARADGVTLPPERARQQIDVTRRMGAYRTSTQIDRQTGRPMEVEAIFGRPVEVARRGGVPVPLMELLYLALSSLSPPLRG